MLATQGLDKRAGQVRRELEPVPAGRGVEGGAGKVEVLDVHHLEARVRDAGCASELDHALRQVDPGHLAVGRDLRGDGFAQRAGSAGQVEHAHARPELEQLDRALAATGLTAGHDLVEPPLVRRGMPAEDRRIEVLRLQAADLFHSCSNQLATRSVSALFRPITWMPTGRPLAGAGRTATGWCVVLNGLVKRVIGSRGWSVSCTRGATIAEAGTRRASTSRMAARAASCSLGRSSSASRYSPAGTVCPRLSRASTSAPYFSGDSATHRS